MNDVTTGYSKINKKKYHEEGKSYWQSLEWEGRIDSRTEYSSNPLDPKRNKDAVEYGDYGALTDKNSAYDVRSHTEIIDNVAKNGKYTQLLDAIGIKKGNDRGLSDSKLTNKQARAIDNYLDLMNGKDTTAVEGDKSVEYANAYSDVLAYECKKNKENGKDPLDGINPDALRKKCDELVVDGDALDKVRKNIENGKHPLDGLDK